MIDVRLANCLWARRTFQAAYIISIVVGLGIGEVLFGRMGSARGHNTH